MSNARIILNDIFEYGKCYAIRLRRISKRGGWEHTWALSLWVSSWESCTSSTHSDIGRMLKRGWEPVEYVLLDKSEE